MVRYTGVGVRILRLLLTDLPELVIKIILDFVTQARPLFNDCNP